MITGNFTTAYCLLPLALGADCRLVLLSRSARWRIRDWSSAFTGVPNCYCQVLLPTGTAVPIRQVADTGLVLRLHRSPKLLLPSATADWYCCPDPPGGGYGIGPPPSPESQTATAKCYCRLVLLTGTADCRLNLYDICCITSYNFHIP